MEFSHFIASENDAGRRFDKVLRKILKSKNLSSIYQALRKNLIKLNDKKNSESTIIQSGDKISIASFLLEDDFSKHASFSNSNEKESIKKSTHTFPYEILLKTDDILVINKPYNVSVQEDLSPLVKKFFTPIASLSFTPAPIHRLDKKTTGILLFSLSLKAQHFFSECFKNHTVQKYYLGIAEGFVKEKIIMEDFLEEDKLTNENFYKMKIATTKSENAKNAITEAAPISHGTFKTHKLTLIEYKIITGRKHQIRVQSSFHGFPLFGDTSYGGSENHLAQNFFLHSTRIEFPENNFSLPKEISSSPPPPFLDFINKYFHI